MEMENNIEPCFFINQEEFTKGIIDSIPTMVYVYLIAKFLSQDID